MGDFPTLAHWTDQGIGLDIFCAAPCHHHAGMTASEALAAFGPEMTLGQIAARVRCSKCGRKGKAQVRFGIEDYYRGVAGVGRC
ncbi:hypothetical protein Q0812_13475 [Brevundimonas sp. 2R-24]|uniref:Uncharacterized protein n=1 Tax=Peiella sedimenti TaxID=3061083 RepID=A0ABT8SPD5_9CAUL|nr:hypothetical protein [Caulobacteraceae bacterium XZ-24]